MAASGGVKARGSRPPASLTLEADLATVAYVGLVRLQPLSVHCAFGDTRPAG
jgi:hypothetical protein